MSDVRKGLSKLAKSKTVAQWEKGEKSEGVRDAIKAGKGDVVAGSKRLGLQKEGLAAALKGVRCPKGKTAAVKKR